MSAYQRSTLDNLAIWHMFKDYTMVKQARFLSNLNLASEVCNIPGAVVEAGVWRGGMSAGIAKVLGNYRRYYLFDSFEGLPPAEEIDGCSASGQTAIAWQDATRHNCTAGKRHATKAMRLAGITNYRLVEGWFSDTMPGPEPYPNGIALLRLDGDWYSSTTQVLEALFPLVNTGGIVIIDDYHYWDGCARAVHDYLSRHGRYERIEQEGPRTPPGRCVAFMRKRQEQPHG